MSAPASIVKRATGVPGLDDMTYGGLPVGATTLITGATGSGKTILTLQVAANAVAAGRPAVVVSFGESADRLRAEARSFAWGDALMRSPHLHLFDVPQHLSASTSGEFDLGGLFAVLDDLLDADDEPWVVLDEIDQLLVLARDPMVAIAQIRRIDAWSEARGIPVLLTGKEGDVRGQGSDYLHAVEFLLPVVVSLSARLERLRLNRRFRIVKYRGTRHVAAEVPMIIDDEGVHLPFGGEFAPNETIATAERVGTGIGRLDEILGGGLHRGSTVLLSGPPGASKTTLAASIVEAAAQRGERALMINFDEIAARIVRNVASVGIELASHVASGLVVIKGRTAWHAVVEEHALALQRRIAEHRPHVLVVDPVSSLFKLWSGDASYLSIERVVAMARANGITTVLTSLDAEEAPGAQSTRSQAATLADTWITLEYRVLRGERNRALSIVKSRGTAHSHQVRELRLSADGIDLVDVYRSGSEVLMGTARLHERQQEQEQVQRRQRLRADRLHELEAELEEELEAVRAERDEVTREERRLAETLDRVRTRDEGDRS